MLILSMLEPMSFIKWPHNSIQVDIYDWS